MKPKLSPSEFKRRVGILKKAGIIDVKNVNDAKPYWVRKAGPRGGSYTLSELIDKYDDIISKKATPVTLPPEETKAFKKLGYETTRKGDVIIPHAATEHIRVTPKNEVVKVHAAGIRRVQIPVEYHNLEQYLTGIKKDYKKIQAMKSRGAKFAFHFFGGHSQTYSDIDLLIDELRHYESVATAINQKDSRAMNEIYRNLEIVEVSYSAWNRSRERAREQARQKSHNQPHYRKKKLARLKRRSAAELAAYRAQRAEEMRQWRASLTGAQKEEYRAKARKRANKSRKG